MCLWKKVSATSYSPAILILLLFYGILYAIFSLIIAAISECIYSVSIDYLTQKFN